MIEYGVYQFNPDDAFRFARMKSKYRQKGNELQFLYCPYCNGGSHHDKNTFYISLDTGQFECKRSGCSVRGNMLTLAKDFSHEFELNRDVSAYYNINGRNNQFRRFRDAHKVIESKDPAVEYLKGRGISPEITKRYEITVRNDNDRVLVFPFKDEEGALQFIKYRNTAYKKGDTGSKEWCESNCKPILFGMNQCQDFETLVITEGQIDSLSLAEAGIRNAVSVPTGKNGFTWKPHCWNWLMKFSEVVVFGDNENGEITLAKEISEFFPKRVRIVPTESYKGCKDANEILQKHGREALIKAVESAAVTIPLAIKTMSSVRKMDFSKLEHISTGFDQLDDTIGGGFYFGNLVIMTGKCGEGKSTVASMMIAHAIRQKCSVFCYSGELQDYVFRSWLDSQILGKITDKEAELNKADAIYNQSGVYIYDNAVIEEYSAIEAAERAIKDLNCRVILIDNLMTAIKKNQDADLYRQQSGFIRECADLARKYNVLVLVVAHPRKGSGTSNDDISGSGDIANYASLVLRYQRGSGDISKLIVTKNRINGRLRLDDDGINMVYFPESRRVLEEGQMQPSFFESSEALPEGFVDMPEDFEIPF